MESLTEQIEALFKAVPPGPERGKPLSEHRIKHAHRTPPKEHRESGATEGGDYADPKNKKYPIHDAAHVRAAISYFSKPKNAAMYTPEERKTMWGRIRRAAKKHGVQVSKDAGKGSADKSILPASLQALEKSRVRAHTRREPSGKVTQVREHETKVQKKPKLEIVQDPPVEGAVKILAHRKAGEQFQLGDNMREVVSVHGPAPARSPGEARQWAKLRIIPSATGKIAVTIPHEGDERFHGHWAKYLTSVDPEAKNGYGFEGDWAPMGRKADLQPGTLVLKCEVSGSRKYQTKNYTLIKLTEDGTWDTVAEAPGRDWAFTMRGPAAEALKKQQQAQAKPSSEVDKIRQMIQKLKTEGLPPEMEGIMTKDQAIASWEEKLAALGGETLNKAKEQGLSPEEADRQIAEEFEKFMQEYDKKHRNLSKAERHDLTKEEKKLASKNIEHHMHHLGKLPGGREQAIAIGISQADRGESAAEEAKKKKKDTGCKSVQTDDDDENPRGEKRPRDGRGKGEGLPDGRRKNRNEEPCPDGGPGGGEGGGRGSGAGRKSVQVGSTLLVTTPNGGRVPGQVVHLSKSLATVQCVTGECFYLPVDRIRVPAENLEKATKGEGSRGGHVIGHTRSGKPIYDSSKHDTYRGFTREEHLEAAKVHEHLAAQHDPKIKYYGQVKKDPDFKWREKYGKALLRHRAHREAALEHREAAQEIVSRHFEAEREARRKQREGR